MNKAILSKTFTILIIITIFLSYPFDVTYGNFIPTSPDTTPPIISVISPTNKTYENKVLLHLNITALAYQQWIDQVAYTLDEQEVLVYSGGIKDLNWSTVFDDLSEGTHSLKVAASCKSYYGTPTSGGRLLHRTYWSYSEVINFTVIYPPEILIISPKNTTYFSPNVNLTCLFNEAILKISYCLDHCKNVTFTQNIILEDLSAGGHEVIVYAQDFDGNTGVSEITYFTIIKPFPTTQILLIIITVIAGLGILAYSIKKRRKT